MSKINWTWEDVDVSEVEGNAREGSLVLSDGQTLYWTADDEDDRVYYVETDEGKISVYEPSRYDKLPVIAALAVEDVINQMEDEERERRH